LSKSAILKEQDSKEVIKHIAGLLDRLGKLYLIPGWTLEHAVILSEWVFDNYKFEELETVTKCLNNPPQTLDENGKIENNWRLTPDRIQKWMSVQLDKVAAERENDLKKYKQLGTEVLPSVDYESYKKRIAEGTALQDEHKGHWSQDPKYLELKAERYKKQSEAMLNSQKICPK
jgi:hypothetical protein